MQLRGINSRASKGDAEMFVSLSEEQVNEKYRTLNSHQRCRILLINKSCHAAAQSIFANTPHIPEVIEAVEQIRAAMEVAVATIVTEHSINPPVEKTDANSPSA